MVGRARGVFGVVGALALSGCMAADDAVVAEGGEGVSATVTSELTVGGYYCPRSGEIAGRTIPDDDTYYVTTFGGGVDTQRMACRGTADGRWLYIADAWRFGCGAKVRVTNPRTGRWCVAEVADVGPNICVERAARRPIIDASPVITRELFNASSAGWSDRITVRAEMVPRDTPLGCGNGSDTSSGGAPPATPPATPPASTATCFSGSYGREMPYGTCLQSRFDRLWYQCSRIGWIQSDRIGSTRRGSEGACTSYLTLP
ncbi:MAG: hypothetical protein R3A52_20195 [Polyangiales bacterium]